MIEQDIRTYLMADATISGLVGQKVYIIQAPTADPTPQLPWVIVEVTSGSRTKISQTKMEEISFARISVDAGPDQLFKGRATIERCKALLENYRGLMGNAADLKVTIGAIRGWAGFGGAYRYQFDATMRFLETYSEPV